MVAVADKLPGSVALTRNVFVPVSAENGVPERVPSALIFNQAGPLTFAKVRVSLGFGSLAFVAIVPLMFWPAVMARNVNGSAMKVGAPLT